ncbi:hypothetical protein [Aestuariimicrobium ganziense]|uniref:hypothetical protein n=1 Tax=Aestuariimicrobium ganziense TaxID=2773677 RepID=UPI00194184B2|nr:hypothetical protein [Aestuariimicrobium ganziense]
MTATRWVVDALIAVATGWVMVVVWVGAHAMGLDGAGRDRGPGRVDTSGIDPPALAVAGALLAALALLGRRWRPIWAWVGGMVAIALYLIADGPAFAAVLVAVVLGLAMVCRGPVARPSPSLALVVFAYAAADPLDLRHRADSLPDHALRVDRGRADRMALARDARALQRR